MRWTEVAGFATGALCVYLVVRQNIWNFPVGMANNVFFIVLFSQVGLYADAGLQIVYIGLALYGWWWWLNGDQGRSAQAMALNRDGRRDARLAHCRDSAAEFLLAPAAANDIIDEVVTGIESHFDDVAEHVGLTDGEHAQLRRRLVLHPSIHYVD